MAIEMLLGTVLMWKGRLVAPSSWSPRRSHERVTQWQEWRTMMVSVCCMSLLLSDVEDVETRVVSLLM